MRNALRVAVEPAPGPPELLACWRTHWYRAYSDADFARLQRTIWSKGYPRRRMEAITLWSGDDLVGGAKLYRFPFLVGGRKCEVGGVGAVIVPEALRGRGYGSALLGSLMARVRELGLAASVLHSDIDPAYYRRLGYRSIGTRQHRALAAAMRKGPTAKGAEPGARSDLAWALQSYREGLGARRFGIRPDASYLAFKAAIFEAFHASGPGLPGHPSLLVSRRHGAFVLSRRHGKELDLALWGGPDAAVHALVRTLVKGDPAPAGLVVRFQGPAAASMEALFPVSKAPKDHSTMVAWPGDERREVDVAGAAAWSVEGF